jgi:hypothetical protein
LFFWLCYYFLHLSDFSVVRRSSLYISKEYKKAEKEQIIADIISAFKSVGDSSAKVADSYYESKHAMPEVVTYVLIVLTAVADIATIALAIREFLKKHSDIKELRIKTKSIDITIKGNMSDEEIRKIVAEGRKIVESEESS